MKCVVALKEIGVLYHGRSGHANTEATLLAAKKRAEALGIRRIVVASTTGRVAIRACEMFKGFDLVVVRQHTGWESPGSQQMPMENEKAIVESGAKIVTASHALSGIERSIRTKWNTVGPLELMADTLRIFGEGTKVCVEITVMAADAGAIPMDHSVVAIAGTDNGADTALVIEPAHSNNFFDLYVSEIVAKPQNRLRSQ